MQTSNFAFLHDLFPVLENFGSLAEQYVYTDPNSCLLKLGMIGETIVKLIYQYDNLPLPYDDTAATRINDLYRDGIINRTLSDDLHYLRKVRNNAAHENYGSVEEGQALLQMTHSICEWFMQCYGDFNYENQPFVMPLSPEEHAEIEAEKAAAEAARKAELDAAERAAEEARKAAEEAARKQAEKEKEEALLREAEQRAAAAPKVDLAVRKKQSQKAAGWRVKSEAETRLMIDEQLRQVGWEADTEHLRHANGTRPQKGRNIAIAEWPTDSTVGNKGYVDYALFIGTRLAATIEAKAAHKDIPSVLDYQCKDYSRNIRKDDDSYRIGTWGEYKVPFTFATNGRPYIEQFETKSGVWFQDLRQPDNPPKALRGWISPSGMEEMLEKDIAAGNRKLEEMSYDLLKDKNGLNLREYQLRAIEAAEKAVVNGQQNILLAMATGTGKTRTILGMIYRFLKTGRFRRILFLVDRTSLGEQAEDVFKDVHLEDLQTLDEIYNIKGLDEKLADKETRVQVATVQSMVKRILYNEGETMPAVTDYDLVIIDEAHRGYILDKEMGEEENLYLDQRDYQSKYRSVVEYFDAVRIALTATPALQTTEIFGQPVFKYSYREAVIEGYLVDHDAPHRIETKLSKEGIHYKPGDNMVLYDPVTQEIMNAELLDDELSFDVETFNRQVITENFNRTVLKEIAKDIDPDSPEIQGKTLIYAVNDQHADLIVKILKEIYAESGVDTDSIMKITGSVGGGNKKKVQEAINHFKNERFPSMVVTVDLLTTGIDVPSITTLVFMRRIRSRILFEQMLGRATRLCPEIHKTHFEIYDAVGVYDSLNDVNNMKPVVTNPATTFSEMLKDLELTEDEKQIRFQISQIIAKLQRRKRNVTPKALEHFIDLTGGKDPTQVAVELNHFSPEEAKKRILEYQEAFRILQEKSSSKHDPLVISSAEDELRSHERGFGNSDRPEDYLDSFADFIKTNRNKIAALEIVCTKPKDLTRESLKNLRLALDRQGFTTQQLNTAVSQMTNEEMTADIISLIRRYAIGARLISHEAKIRKAVERLRKAHSFTKQELNWLGKIEKYLMNESVLNVTVFDDDDRFKAQGGFNKINKAFQNKLESIVLELNEYLYDDGGRSA